MTTPLSPTAVSRAPFNGDFYNMAATVIPVLFIAIAFEDAGWIRLRLWIYRMEDQMRVRATAARGRLRWRRGLLTGARYALEQLAATLTMVQLLSISGEIAAILAVEHQQATQLEHDLTRGALMVLVVLMGAALFGRVAEAAQRETRRLEGGSSASEGLGS